ncbi:MAG: LamG-like jellyroll fold domain-containing protein [Candidatus Hermodarchaeia archaeon]|jgi:hypothetical protein
MAFSNNSIKFDGIDGYADAEYATLLNFERVNTFSISCWAKTKSTEPISTIISKMDSSSGTGYRISTNASGQYEVVLRNTAVTDSLRVRTVADGYNDGGWHHLVITYDGLGNILIYIDGLVKVTTTVYNTLSSSTTNTAPFHIGAQDGTNVFDGSIDEVAIYTRVLSAEQVLSIFGSAKPSDLETSAYTPLTYSSEYDGTGEHIDFGFNGVTRYQPNVPFSLAIWMRSYRPHDNGTEALMSHWNWSPSPGSLGWLLFRYDDGSTSHVGFTMRKNDSTYFLKRTDTAAGINISSGIWRFVVITYDGSGDENGIKLYIDAEEITTGLLTASAGTVDSIDYATYGTKLRVGQTHSGANAYRGRLLHSAAISRELSAAEISELFSAGRPIDITTVVDTADISHWCTLGDGCTTGSGNCPDLSPNAIHGTSQSMETTDFTVSDLPPTFLSEYSPLSKSLLLDGVDEYVEYVEDTGNQLVRTEPFTISIWFKVVTDQEGFLIGRYHNPAGPGANRGWYIRYLAGGSLRWGMVVSSDTGSGLTYQFWTLSAGVNDGEWHQWTVAFNGDNVSPHVNSMLDGVYKPEGSHTITLGGGIRYQPMAHPGEPLRIGYGDDGLGGYKYFDGNVAHAAIHKGVEMGLWDMILLYAAGNPQSLNAQVNNSYLSFWDTLGDGDAIGAGNMVDLSAYGNNGEAFNCESGDFVSDVPVGESFAGIGDALPNPFVWWRMGDGDTYPVLLDQMVAQYAFPVAYDLSGNGYHGTATNMEAADAVRDVPRTDFCKYSALFNGSTNYITMGNVLAFEYTDPFSISFWFKSTSGGFMVAKSATTGPSRGYGVGFHTGGTIKWEMTNSWSGNVNFVYTTATGFNDGDWHHCVVTWDGNAIGGAGGMHIYIDNNDEPLTTVYSSLSATIVTTNSFWIGGRDAADHQYFSGYLAEVAIYDSELSSADVEWIYNDGLPRDLLDGYAPSNLAAWWRVGTIDQANKQARDLVWGSSPETSQISDMSRLVNHATATNTEAGDFTTDTPGGEAQYSVDLNDHLFSIRSIDFDGSNDYVTMGNAYAFDRLDPFSVSFWIKTTDTGQVVIMGNLDLTPEYEGWEIYMDTSEYLVFQLVHDGAVGPNMLQVRNNSNAWRDGTWRHWCITYDGSSAAAGVTMYLDGSPVATTTNNDSLTGSTISTAEMGFGCRVSESSYFFAGKLDEVSIYDKELTAGEVSAIYNGGDPTDLSLLSTAGNLAGWWRMGEGDAYPTIYDNGLVPQPFAYPKIFDMSGYDNHGTMTNMEVDDSVADYPRSAFTKYSVDFGSGEYVTMGDESELDFDSTDVFSLSCWFKTTMSGDGTLISKMEATPFKGYLLYVRSGGKIAFRLINTWNTNLIDVETSTTWNDGDWHHVTLVYDGSQSAAGVTMYIDGVSEALTTIFDTLSATTLNTATFRLAYRHSNEYPYVGKLADAVVYNIGLSAADASWMYNSGIPLDLRDGYDDGDGYNDGYIIGYWRPGNGYDELGYVQKIQDWVWGDVSTKETTTITDASFLKNNLTLNNVAADDIASDTPGGMSNYSCRFNGVDGYAYTALGTANYAIENGDVLSLSGWVKTTSSDATEYLWGNALSGATKKGYHVFLSSGKPTFEMAANDSGAAKLIVQATSATVNDGYWHNVIFTERWISNNNYSVTCYVDGYSVDLTTLNNALDSNSITGTGFSIGGRGALGDDPLDGYIDEVSVYHKALSQSDADDIYSGGSPVDLRSIPSAIHMKGWWRMGDSYGIVGTAVNTDAVDKNGDVPGTSVYTSKSLRFDVADEYVDIGNPSELNFDVSDSFSISVWVKNSGDTYQGVVGKIAGGVGWYIRTYNTTATTRCFLQFVMDGSGIIEVYMGDRRGAFPYNEWVNVVVTYDGTNDGNGVKFYMNGELYPTYIHLNTANTTILNSGDFTAGLANSTYNIGNMDELSVWDKELSQADVTAIWNGGDPANLSLHASVANLAGWWRMTDGLGPIDGTMTNMAADDINGDIPVASPEYLITAAGSSEIDFGAAYNYKWTAGVWIKTDNEFGVIINKNYSTDFSGWGMRLLSGYPTLWWANNPTSLLTEQRSDVRVDDGYWHHVVAVRILPSGGAPTCKFYVDGVLTGTVTVQNTNAGNAINNSGTVAIGLAKGSGEGEQPFIGKIAEVAVWNGDFTSDEVLDIYNGGSPPNLIDLSTEPRLRGWWRCGDDNGNPGTYTNFATTAKLGDVPGEEYSTDSFDLDGTNEYVAIDSGISYERTDAFSVSCWFKAQTRNEWPLSQMATYGWYLDELDNTPYWRMEGATGAIRIYFGYEDIILDNEWYHMVVTYDGSSTAAGTKMYIDGVEIPAIQVALDTLAGSIAGGTINIGNREGVYFDGQVDEVSIWSKELSAVEVDEIYNDGVPSNVSKHSAVSNLDGWWKLGEDNGNDVIMINMLSGDIVLNAPREAGAIGEQIDYFLMRGIDSACGTLTYYYWLVTESPDFLGAEVDAGDLPCGGPLTDIVIASSWSVIN